MNKYTAITIGPIYKTLTSVKSTKAVWAASYFFSWIMEQLVLKITDIKPVPPEILMPSIGKQKGEYLQVGLYPDRCVIKGEIDLEDIKKKVIDTLAQKIKVDLKSQSKTKNKLLHYQNIGDLETQIRNFLKSYLQIHIVYPIVPDGENAILYINQLLDSQELNQTIITEESHPFLTDWFEKVYYNYFIKEEFGRDSGFPCTAEIGTAEFQDDDKYKNALEILKPSKKANEEGTDEEEAQQKFYAEIKNEFKDQFRNYHKYIAIVQADGDNMGKLIKAIYKEKGEGLFKDFSAKLFEFTKDAVELIKKHQGTPIYAGGDDLLFFAPVAHTTTDENEKINIKKTIFNLVNQIDAKFREQILEDVELKLIIEKMDDKPALSYGISISYYKYPLNEALQNAANLLFGKAKTGHKNKVALEVRKHSGQQFGAVYTKAAIGAYMNFHELLALFSSKSLFLNSIAHSLENQKAVFLGIGKETEKRDLMLKYFFTNNFNESVHLGKKDPTTGKRSLSPFMEQVKILIKAIYTEQPIDGTDLKEQEVQNEQNLQKIYASLRFIDFITNKEER